MIDLGKIKELLGIEPSGDALTIKAATTYFDIMQSADVKKAIPAIAYLTSVLGDPAVRYRGTIGGSIANNDPAADYPAALLALGATVKTNKRSISAEDFFKGLFTTALEDGEIITAVSFPVPAKAGYAKFRHPASRFALTGVFVAKTKAGDIRVAATGASQSGVMRVPAIEAALKANWSAGAIDSVKISAERIDGRYPRNGGISRQPDQGDGAARGDRGGLTSALAPTTNSHARRAAMRAALYFGPFSAKEACHASHRRDNLANQLIETSSVATFAERNTTCSINQPPNPPSAPPARSPASASSNSPASARARSPA